MHVNKWWMINLFKTISFCAISLEINQWNVHCFTPVYPADFPVTLIIIPSRYVLLDYTGITHPYPRSPHFPCGENVDGSIRTGTRRNLRILIWEKMRRKCGENADGSIRTGTRRNLRVLIWKKMRRKCGWEYSDRNTEKSPHYIRISAITRR